MRDALVGVACCRRGRTSSSPRPTAPTWTPLTAQRSLVLHRALSRGACDSPVGRAGTRAPCLHCREPVSPPGGNTVALDWHRSARSRPLPAARAPRDVQAAPRRRPRLVARRAATAAGSGTSSATPTSSRSTATPTTYLVRGGRRQHPRPRARSSEQGGIDPRGLMMLYMDPPQAHALPAAGQQGLHAAHDRAARAVPHAPARSSSSTTSSSAARATSSSTSRPSCRCRRSPRSWACRRRTAAAVRLVEPHDRRRRPRVRGRRDRRRDARRPSSTCTSTSSPSSARPTRATTSSPSSSTPRSTATSCPSSSSTCSCCCSRSPATRPPATPPRGACGR